MYLLCLNKNLRQFQQIEKEIFKKSLLFLNHNYTNLSETCLYSLYSSPVGSSKIPNKTNMNGLWEEHFVHRSQPVVYPFLYAVVSPYLYDSILIHQKNKGLYASLPLSFKEE